METKVLCEQCSRLDERKVCSKDGEKKRPDSEACNHFKRRKYVPKNNCSACRKKGNCEHMNIPNHVCVNGDIVKY